LKATIRLEIVKILMKLKINKASHLGNYNIYIGPYHRYWNNQSSLR